MFTRAAVRQGIRAGAKPYILKIHFRAEHIVSKPLEGQYQEIWMAPDRWRRELVLADFQQVEVGSADSNWVSRNLDFSPLPTYLLEIALDAFIEPKILVEERATTIRKKKGKGSELRCVELASPKTKRALCFDDAGTLVSEEYLNQRFEYENFGTYNEEVFPRAVHIYEDDKKVLELTAEDLAPPTEPKGELFRPENGALQLAPCMRWPAIPTNKIAPEYPQEARHAHQQGTVTVYALVSADGRIGTTKVLESAGQGLDQATIEAVRQWTYPAIACGAHPLSTEIEIRVNYSLSSH